MHAGTGGKKFKRVVDILPRVWRSELTIDLEVKKKKQKRFVVRFRERKKVGGGVGIGSL